MKERKKKVKKKNEGSVKESKRNRGCLIVFISSLSKIHYTGLLGAGLLGTIQDMTSIIEHRKLNKSSYTAIYLL